MSWKTMEEYTYIYNRLMLKYSKKCFEIDLDICI